MAISVHSLVVTCVEPQGSDAIQLSLGVTAQQQEHFGFQAGQYLTLAVTVQGQEHWRCYSITSEPVAGLPITVLVRRVAGGRVSNWLCDHAQEGMVLKVLPPAGRFTLARPGQPVLLYAGGSGIAPVYALAREALQQGAPRVRLFYANRDRATAMLLTQLEALQKAAAARLEVVYWFDAEQGLPTTQELAAQVEGLALGDAYLCGPEPFMQTVNTALQAVGLDTQHIHREDFGAEQRDADAEEASGPQAQLTVQMKGQSHTLTVQPGEVLLAAMLRAGLPAPHACRVGECASCMCRLQEGEVQRLECSVLDEDDVADGWLLACRSRAVSTALRVHFS